jgi:hypothetical protein
MLRNVGQLRRCYEQSLGIEPYPLLHLDLRMVVDLDGFVLGANAGDSPLRIPATAACVGNAAHRWRFPARNGLSTVHVHVALTAR